MKGTASSQAADHPFEVNCSNHEYLAEDDIVKFYNYFANLLFLYKRAGPDQHKYEARA
jgi:hypothetical protein